MTKTKKRLVYIGIPVLIVIVLIAVLSTRKPKVEYSTVLAKESSLTQTVSETGTVKPIKEISLNFLSVGKIDSVLVKVGDTVELDQVLASLDSEALNLRRQEAEAALSIASANLSKTKSGASLEAVNVSRRALEQAQTGVASGRLDVEKTQRTAEENIRQAQKTYDDLVAINPVVLPSARQAVLSAETTLSNTEKNSLKAIENAKGSLLLSLGEKILSVRVAMNNVEKIFSDENAKNVLSAKNFVYKSQTENAKDAVLSSIAGFDTLLSKARASGEKNDVLLASSYLADLLFSSSKTLDSAYLMLENTVTSSTFPQASLDAYKSTIISQSTQINASASSLESLSQGYKNSFLNYETGMANAESSLDSAKSALDSAILAARNAVASVKLASEQQNLAASSRLDNAIKSVNLAQAQYNNTVAPARYQDLQLAEAQVSQASASLENIMNQINDSMLKAPMAGVITAVNFKVGEQFASSPTNPMIKMLVDNSFEVEVDISESNISKVKVGNPVAITLDAFSDDLILDGVVSFIEPAQTLISGVVYYKVIIQFVDMANINSILEARSLSLKSGMTANVTITTDSREKVISVPSRAIIEGEGGAKVVRVKQAKDYIEVAVETGLRGDSGQVEIIGNIHEGDEIITLIREK